MNKKNIIKKNLKIVAFDLKNVFKILLCKTIFISYILFS